jgi:hypothetical protein
MTLFLAVESVAGHLEFFSNLRFQTVGVMIVLTSLGGLAIIVTAVGRALEPRLGGGSRALPAAVQSSAQDVPPEIRAAIAAAVVFAVKTPHRILTVTQTHDPRLSAWSVEGRRQIFHSHTVR